MADPTTVSGLTYRMRPTGLGLSNGAPVSSVPLLTGSATLTQATAGNRPTILTSGGAGGQPALRFDGVDDWMAFTIGSALSQPFTVCVVLQFSVSNGASQILHLGNSELLIEGTAWEAYASSLLSGGTPTTAVAVVTATFNGASSTIHVNGTQVAAGAVGGGTATGTFNLGRHPAVSRPLPADVYEILVYSGAKTSGDRAEIHTWVQDTYGVTVADYTGAGGGGGGGGGAGIGVYQRLNADGSLTTLTLQGVWDGSAVVPTSIEETPVDSTYPPTYTTNYGAVVTDAYAPTYTATY
jgi:hypothetical protein